MLLTPLRPALWMRPCYKSNALSLTLRTPFGVLWTRLQPRVVGGANPSARAAARAFLQPEAPRMRSARRAEQSRQKVRKRRAALRPHAPEKRAQTPFFPDAFPLPTFIEGVADADDLPETVRMSGDAAEHTSVRTFEKSSQGCGSCGKHDTHCAGRDISPRSRAEGGEQEGTIPPLSLPRLNCHTAKRQKRCAATAGRR